MSRVLSLTLADSPARTIRISVAWASSFVKSSLFNISFGTSYAFRMVFMNPEGRAEWDNLMTTKETGQNWSEGQAN